MTTIYYVEDDRDIAENVKTYLQIRQMEVHLFYSIADAKQALLRKCPDLLLLDRNMPDGNGDELCKWIRRLWGNQPDSLFNGSGKQQNIVQGFQNGADDYVVNRLSWKCCIPVFWHCCAGVGNKGNPAFLRSSFA
ncbi:MAG: response regulator [Ruminococcus sp.]